MTTTGGHGDSTNGLATELQELLAPVLPGTANGPDEMRAAVRQRYKDGADAIKIAATGGVLSLAKSGQAPLFTDEELKAVVETARDYGMTVIAHAHGSEGMLRAVKAGVHSIEHGTFMTDDVMTAMKEHGTYYVATISAGKFVAEKAKVDGYFPEVVRPKAAAIGPQIQATFAKALKAGVKIAFGTDQGVAPHGDNGLEFVYMVEAGMPAMAAIKVGDERHRGAAGHGERPRHRRGRQDRRPGRSAGRSAVRHLGDDAGELRDEGRHGAQALSPCPTARLEPGRLRRRCTRTHSTRHRRRHARRSAAPAPGRRAQGSSFRHRIPASRSSSRRRSQCRAAIPGREALYISSRRCVDWFSRMSIDGVMRSSTDAASSFLPSRISVIHSQSPRCRQWHHVS